MDRLSFELIEQIANQLTARDTLSLAGTCRNVRAACLSRLDPERYLQTTFRHARYLLAAMSDFGCVLTGSRALEYFVPGSIEDKGIGSDWDFMVPCVTGSVYGMMGALEACGVRWCNPLDELFAIVGQPVGTTVSVPAYVVREPIADDLLRAHAADHGDEAADLFRRLARFVADNHFDCLRDGVRIEATRAERGDAAAHHFTKLRDFAVDNQAYGTYADNYGTYGTYGTYGQRIVCLINGYVHVPGGARHKVQLFQTHQTRGLASTPLEYIVKTFYATHVQCFLGGWAAGHFYDDLTRRRLALVWRTDGKSQRTAVGKCVGKYRPRGYRFFDVRCPDMELDDSLALVRHESEGQTLRKRSEYGMSRLGQPGTLVLRFQSLHRGIRRLADDGQATDDDRRSPALEGNIRAADQALYKLRFGRRTDEGHPEAFEPCGCVPVLPPRPQTGGATILGEDPQLVPDLCRILARASLDDATDSKDSLGHRGAPSGVTPVHLTSSGRGAAFYRTLIRITRTACCDEKCYEGVRDKLPPQI